MSYLVFARKYRPQTFEDVVGQQHVATTLSNAIIKDRLAQAYLFSGSRGTGKTTMARILSKCLNCEAGPTAHPCGQCPSCLEIRDGYYLDVIEIDGASNRGIDEIRELRERVRFAPAKGRYKVYIIDEVHMLTQEAFNALLKTLEEPPGHVIFIFATTEAHKLPATILSRCQRFDFKRVSVNDIVQVLKRIADKEGVSVGEDGLRLIARSSEGGLRDAESILDQAISYSLNSNITINDIRAVLGLGNEEKIISLIETVSQQDASKGINLLSNLIDEGIDISAFVRELIFYLRDLLLIKLGSQSEGLLERPQDSLDMLQTQASRFNTEELMRMIDCLREVNEKLRQSPWQARLILEMAVIKMVEIKAGVSLKGLLEKIIQLEERLKVVAPARLEVSPLTHLGKPVPEVSLSEHRKPLLELTVKEPNPCLSQPLEEQTETAKVEELWLLLRQRVKKQKPSLEGSLSIARLMDITDKSLTLGFTKETAFFQRNMIENNKKIIEALIEEVFKKSLLIKTVVIDNDEKEGLALSKPQTDSIERAVDIVLSTFPGAEVVK